MTHFQKKSTVVLATAACLASTGRGLALASPAAATKPGSGSDLGTGSVFKVNPVQSSGDESLTDQKDSGTAVPASQYATVQLRNLDGSGYLVGKWANVRTSTGPLAYSPTNSFVYRRDDDRFEQVMAYFWVNQAQEYLQSLGFGIDAAAGERREPGRADRPVRHRQQLLHRQAGLHPARQGRCRRRRGRRGDRPRVRPRRARLAGARASAPAWTPGRSARRSATTSP